MNQPNNGYPPDELTQKWCRKASSAEDIIKAVADWQLDRCCEELRLMEGDCACDELRAICRPKPKLPTKQEARNLLDAGIYHNLTMHEKQETYNKLRALIDSLPDD